MFYSDLPVLANVLVTLVIASLLALLLTPVVRSLAIKMGAMDVPKDSRRMHDHPIPRMGGLAIFFGFILSVLLFAEQTPQLRGMLLGSVVIVILGILDDIYTLSAKLKLVVQILAALIAAVSGNLIDTLSNPNVFSSDPYWHLGWLAWPITVLWIVLVTNAVNLIDGLDGLACGVSIISSLTMLVIALVLGENAVAVLLAALVGGCIGFLPYNLHPARIFMGDTGSTLLGFVLAVTSIQGMFKMYSVISFVAPFLVFGLPIFDTSFAFIRRIATGHSPMSPDRGHIHHRLIDMGFSQKQAVGVLYVISAILGLSAVVLTTSGPVKAILLLAAVCVAGLFGIRVFLHGEKKKEEAPPPEGEQESGEQIEE